MQSFKNFTEEKQVTLSGGGKTISLKPGQNVSFTHATTGKKVSGTFRKKKMMGGRQYAHVDMPDKTGMYVPVHHINEAVEVSEETMNIGDHAKLAKYADERGGIDKDALHTAAKHMKSGDMQALKKHLRAMDTDPRDKAIEHIDKSHLKTLGYTIRGMKEEVEQIDEISLKTLVSYGSKAQKQVKGNQPSDPDKLRKRTNREQGIKLAFNKHYQFKAKVPGTVSANEEVDYVDESMHKTSRYDDMRRQREKASPSTPSNSAGHVPAKKTSITRMNDKDGKSYTLTTHSVNGKEVSSKKVYDEEVQYVDEKLNDDAKKNIQRALGSKHQSNTLRKTSSAAKAMIAIAKSNPKNMK